jgi:hypothetical protein
MWGLGGCGRRRGWGLLRGRSECLTGVLKLELGLRGVERKELETGVVDVDGNDISQDPDLWNLLYASTSFEAVTTTHRKGFWACYSREQRWCSLRVGIRRQDRNRVTPI